MSKQVTLTEQEFCDLSLKTMNKGYSPEEMRPFYKALAPYLQREFPREQPIDIEGLARFVDDFGITLSSKFLEALRLWNGAEIPDKIEQPVCPYHGGLTADTASCSCGKVTVRRPGRPVCPTCGGSEEVCQSYRMQNCDLQGTGWDPRKCRAEISAKRCSLGVNYLPEPCPDCKPCETCKGIRGHICTDGKFRKWGGLFCSNCSKIRFEPCPDCIEKCMRCGVVNSVESAISCHRRYADGTSATGKGGQIGKHRFVDQRNRQQRKGSESKSVQYYPGGTDQDSYAAFSYCDWRYRPDRREGDRRSKILTGSLKATRPQE